MSGRRGSRLLLHTGRVCEAAEYLDKLCPGRSIGLLYVDDEGGDDLWHERILLYPASESGNEWWVMTPDRDVYVENVTCSDADSCDRAFVCGDGRQSPAQFKGLFYAFGSYLRSRLS